MLEFKRLTIDDKLLIDSFIVEKKIENSEMNFTNFFLWGASSELMYAIQDETLYISFSYSASSDDPQDKNRKFFFPVSKKENPDFEKMLEPIVEFYKNKNEFSVLCVTEQNKQKTLEKTDKFEFLEDRDNFDYIYQTQDLINFAGKKFHSKRNFINRLLMEHHAVYLPYKDEYFDECWALYTAWYRSKNEEEAGMNGEPLATNAALSFYKELGLVGGVVKVDGKIQAFTFGEKITNDMVLVHLEKANAEITGLYPFTTQQFAQNEWKNVKYLNRMEDMGIEGMRKAKLSLQPEKMIVKYKMRLKQ